MGTQKPDTRYMKPEPENIEPYASITELKEFITTNSCSTYLYPHQNNEYLFKTKTNYNIVNAIQQLLLYISKLQSTTHTKWLDQHSGNHYLVTFMEIRYLISLKKNGRKECVQICYDINPDSQGALDIEVTKNHSTITIITRENINEDTRSSQTKPISLHLYLNSTQT